MLTGNNLIEKWSQAHTSFNRVEQTLDSNRESPSGIYHSFFRDALAQSPNGFLYYRSAFLEDLAVSDKMYLGHVTFHLDEIKKSKSLYASGGCLVGSTYCFPMSKVADGSFRVHNLGEFIYREETLGRGNKIPDLVLFEINTASRSHGNLLGTNYLKLGDVHFELFSELEYLLFPRELHELKTVVESGIVQSLPFFKLCNEAWLEQIDVDSEVLFRALNETIPRIPFLGYVFFESIAEYLMLYSDSAEAQKYTQVKEVYNVPYKRLMYAFYPEYKQNFRLSDFNPNKDQVCGYISDQKFIEKFDVEHFATYVTRKVISSVNQLLLTGKTRISVNKTWNFQNIVECFKPLVGHLIHRQLRSFGRYPDFYFYYDQLKALQIWNYWNHMGVSIPFNGVFPKGEVGINPAHPSLSLRAFQCQVEDRDGFLFARPKTEFPIRLVPRLVDIKYTLLRNKPS